MLLAKYQSSKPPSFRDEVFWSWSSLVLVQLVTPGQGLFWPHGHHMNRLSRGLQGDATYKISVKAPGLLVSEKKNLKMGFFVPIFQLVTTGPSQFWPRGHHINKLGTGLQGDAIYTKYQSSRPSSFREEEFWSLPFVPMFKLVTHETGPILIPGASYEQTW